MKNEEKFISLVTKLVFELLFYIASCVTTTSSQLEKLTVIIEEAKELEKYVYKED